MISNNTRKGKVVHICKAYLLRCSRLGLTSATARIRAVTITFVGDLLLGNTTWPFLAAPDVNREGI